MAYKVIILYRLYMPSYFLGTFTEYPFFDKRNIIRSFLCYLLYHNVFELSVRLPYRESLRLFMWIALDFDPMKFRQSLRMKVLLTFFARNIADCR